MTKEKYNVDINKLSSLNLYQLREVGSKIGVKNPTAMKTEELRNAIKMVVKGQIEPYEKIKSGRPHRREIIPDEDWNKVVGYDSSINYTFGNSNSIFGTFCSTAGSKQQIENDVFSGIAKKINNPLYIMKGTLSKIDTTSYVVVDPSVTYANKIHETDYVECIVENKNTKPIVTKIIKINQQNPAEIKRVNFDNLLPCSLGEQIKFDLPQLQFLNNICPIHLGQRVMISGKLGSGQTYLTNSIAKDLERKYAVVFLATSKRPEERIYLDQVDYIFTTFDTLPQDLLLYYELAYERAKRLCENGENAILIIDDIVMLMQTIRNILSERSSNVQEYYDDILQQFKKLLALSKNTQNGSLTIICATSHCSIDTFNEYVEQLDDLCNCHIKLNYDAYIKGDLEFFEKDKTYAETIRKI